jgi:hypothetical protein
MSDSVVRISDWQESIRSAQRRIRHPLPPIEDAVHGTLE